MEEAENVVQVAKYLLEKGISPQSIQILVFYQAQQHQIEAGFILAGWEFLLNAVSTVIGYQGLENDIIQLSCAHSQEEFD